MNLDHEHDLLPDPRPDGGISGLAAAVESASWPARLLYASIAAGVGFGCANAATELFAIRHWAVWILLFLVVEPISLAGFATAMFILAPRSALARRFAFVVRRAKLAVYVVAILWAMLITWVVVFVWKEVFPQ